jgi:hypothetical protein
VLLSALPVNTCPPVGAQDSAGLSAAVAAMAGAPAGAGGRATPQNWRAGIAAVSRSTTLRRPVADAMAADALKLVKKWARDRCETLCSAGGMWF